MLTSLLPSGLASSLSMPSSTTSASVAAMSKPPSLAPPPVVSLPPAPPIVVPEGSSLHESLIVAPPEPKSDWCLKDFTILHRLGGGQYGTVFLASVNGTNFVVALKKLSIAELDRWNAYRRQRLLDDRGLGELTLEQYHAQIADLRLAHPDDATKQALLDQLAAWGSDLQRTL